MAVYPTKKIFLAGVLVSLGGNFHFGYQLMVLNPTKPVFQVFVNESYYSHQNQYMTDETYRLLWSIILNILTIGSVLTLPCVPFIAERFGRKLGLYIGSIMCILSCLPMALSKAANSYELLTFGRFTMGFSCALIAGFQVLYLNEISAPETRGLLSYLNGFFVEVGFVTANIFALPGLLGTSELWEWLFWIEMIPSLILLVSLPSFPESPKYLLQKSEEKQAYESLGAYMSDEDAIERVIHETREELKLQAKSMGIIDVLGDRRLRGPVFLGCFITSMVPLSGVVAVNYLTSYFMTQVGFSIDRAAYLNLIIVFTSLFAVFVSMNLIDRFGRRPLLIICNGSMALLNIMFLALFEVYGRYPFAAAGYIFLVGASLFMFCLSTGPGPIEWFIAAELVPQNARSAATSISLFCMYVTMFSAGFAFFPLEGVIGSFSFFMFIIPLTVATFCFYFKLPETKNRPIEAVLEDYYSRKIPILSKIFE